MYFAELSHAEASALARQWEDTAPQRVRYLSTRFPSINFDRSYSSLRGVLSEASEQFQWASDQPLGPVPMWFEENHFSGYHRLSTDSLWLVDALALYLGEVLIERDPVHLRWGLYCEHRPDRAWHHHPAVVGYRWPYSTFEDMALFAVKASAGRREDPQRVVAGLNFYLSLFRPMDEVA